MKRLLEAQTIQEEVENPVSSSTIDLGCSSYLDAAYPGRNNYPASTVSIQNVIEEISALSGASITYEISNDNVNWSPYAAATNITEDTTSWFFGTLPPSFRYLRWTLAVSGGSMTVTTNILINGEG